MNRDNLAEMSISIILDLDHEIHLTHSVAKVAPCLLSEPKSLPGPHKLEISHIQFVSLQSFLQLDLYSGGQGMKYGLHKARISSVN